MGFGHILEWVVLMCYNIVVMSEIWGKIVRYQEEIRRQRENPQKLNKIEEPETEWLRNRRIENKKRENAIKIVTSVLEEIRANSREIRQARFSLVYNRTGQHDYTSVYLAWGNKHGKTKEEMRILEEYHQIDDKKQKQADRLPVSFIGEDFYQIGTGVYEYLGDPLNSSLPPRYITSPELPIAMLAGQLMNPKHYFTRYVKGVDYWRDPSRFKQWEPPRDPYQQQ